MPDRNARRNAWRYCELRDRQFALYDAIAKRNGMTTTTLFVLNAILYAKGGITQRDIAAQAFQSKQAVNLVVKRLRAEGSVELAEKPGNGREKVVSLTEEGRRRYGPLVRHITWAEDAAMADFAPEEQALLVDLQERFIEKLTELMETEPQGYREEV